ncbi:MAG TPA: DUF1552 domain-containing protein [Polyangia bacterium]|nr:DUF1552 domain-containing protein [Polyangia bacterium]
MIPIGTRVTRERLSRRAFLRRLGASAAVLPLLDVERTPAAGPSGFPKRLVTIAWANGVAQSLFYPPGDDPTESPILAPLAPVKSKVTLVVGVDLRLMVDGGHGADGHFSGPCLFTGTYKNIGGQQCTATGASIDQVVATAAAAQVQLPVPLLNICVQGASASTSYRADGSVNTGESDPVRLFNTLFASRALPPDQLAALKARRGSVLDYLTTELGSYGARLGTDDRVKVAAHLESIRQLEMSLAVAPADPTCVAAAPNEPGLPTDYQGAMKAFSDLVATALRCDLTRAVSLVWADHGGSEPYAMPFLNLGGSDLAIGEVHAIAHLGPDGYPLKSRIDGWYMSQLAYLAQALDGTPEGAGTILDNSLLVMGNAQAEGSTHRVDDIPFVLVGRAGGALRAGRVVRTGAWQGTPASAWTGAPRGVTPAELAGAAVSVAPAAAGADRGSTSNNELLASISTLMDVPATSFGTGYPGTLAALL